jgi:hypothetical protein
MANPPLPPRFASSPSACQRRRLPAPPCGPTRLATQCPARTTAPDALPRRARPAGGAAAPGAGPDAAPPCGWTPEHTGERPGAPAREQADPCRPTALRQLWGACHGRAPAPRRHGRPPVRRCARPTPAAPTHRRTRTSHASSSRTSPAPPASRPIAASPRQSQTARPQRTAPPTRWRRGSGKGSIRTARRGAPGRRLALPFTARGVGGRRGAVLAEAELRSGGVEGAWRGGGEPLHCDTQPAAHRPRQRGLTAANPPCPVSGLRAHAPRPRVAPRCDEHSSDRT